jgi:hypothetical protein
MDLILVLLQSSPLASGREKFLSLRIFTEILKI